MAPHPLINKPAPQFSIPDAKGQIFKFPPEEQGQRVRKPIALFFYSESGTFVCTREARQFRDALAENEIFKRTGVLVIGISGDPVPKQKEFVESQKLPYPILSDEKHVSYKAFQVGKSLLGLSRTTFVIDPDGIIRASFSATLNYSAHVTFVIKILKKLTGEGEHQSSTQRPPESSAGEADTNAPGPAEPIRDELGRVAYVVGA